MCVCVCVCVVERSASWQFKSLYESALANLFSHFTGVVDIKVSSDVLNFVDLPAATETTHNNQSKHIFVVLLLSLSLCGCCCCCCCCCCGKACSLVVGWRVCVCEVSVRDGGIFAELGHEQVSKVVKNFAWGSILTPVHHGRISSRPRASPT